MSDITDCLRCLADPTRRAILELLREDELSVQQIAERFPVSRVAISKHLRQLREAGLVNERRAGRERLHTLQPAPLAGVDAWLLTLRAQTAAAARPPTPSVAAPPPRPTPRAKPRPALPADDGWRQW